MLLERLKAWRKLYRKQVSSSQALHGVVSLLNMWYSLYWHLPGPGYKQAGRVFDLEQMPYSFEHMHSKFSQITNEQILYLPRTSDLNQISDAMEDSAKAQAVHYCIHENSKALCLYLGSWKHIEWAEIWSTPVSLLLSSRLPCTGSCMVLMLMAHVWSIRGNDPKMSVWAQHKVFVCLPVSWTDALISVVCIPVFPIVGQYWWVFLPHESAPHCSNLVLPGLRITCNVNWLGKLLPGSPWSAFWYWPENHAICEPFVKQDSWTALANSTQSIERIPTNHQHLSSNWYRIFDQYRGTPQRTYKSFPFMFQHRADHTRYKCSTTFFCRNRKVMVREVSGHGQSWLWDVAMV